MKKIIDITPFATYPPHMGGQIIIHQLNSILPEFGWGMEQFSLGIRKEDLKYIGRKRIYQHAPGYSETRRTEPISVLSFLMSVALHSPLYWAPKVIKFRPWNLMESAIETSEAVMVEAPWCYVPERIVIPQNTPLIYMAHNAEFQLLERWKKKFPFGEKIGNYVEGLESRILKDADLIFTLSDQDTTDLAEKYDFDQEKVSVLIRGIDTEKCFPISDEQKILTRKKFGLSEKPLIIFVGSQHSPNTIAAEFVVELAKQYGNDFCFLIAGSVTNTIEDIAHEKVLYRKGNPKIFVQIADIALNPMTTGSGLNIKMLEYFAFGLPVITTKFGARGIDGMNGEDYILSELQNFSQNIVSLIQNKKEMLDLSINARKLVEEKYSSYQGAKLLSEKIILWKKSNLITSKQ